MNTYFFCQCGKRFRSYAAEARHRHNFPLLCRPARKPAAKIKWSKLPGVHDQSTGAYRGYMVKYIIVRGLLVVYLNGVEIGSRSTLTKACELIYEHTHQGV